MSQAKSSILPEPEFLEINDDYLVMNKSGGVLTQAPPGIDSLELRVQHWKRLQTGEEHPYVGVPHRLDRPVSGVIVFGQNRKVTRRLADQFQNREIKKYYWAIVENAVKEESGTWTDFMRKIPDQARSEIVAADHIDAQLAKLNFNVLARSTTSTCLRIELETGRTHQIRLQCAAHNHPVWGDDLYGSGRTFGPQTDDLRERWIALHSRKLVFFDHRQKNRREFLAPLPPPWDAGLSGFPKLREIEF